MTATGKMPPQVELQKLMGQYVFVLRELTRVWTDRTVKWCVEDVEPYAGWIVGFRWKQHGRIVSNGDDSNEFLESNRIPAVLIAKQPTSQPRIVPLDGYLPLKAVRSSDGKKASTTDGHAEEKQF